MHDDDDAHSGRNTAKREPVALIWGMSRHPASSSREAALALPICTGDRFMQLLQRIESCSSYMHILARSVDVRSCNSAEPRTEHV